MKFEIEDWLPKSLILLRNYDRHKFVSDLIAGVTVGLVALPLAMAFAIASGVPPQAGLYCAIVTGFLISALGGSKTQIGGPTGAFVVVVAGIIAKHGIDGRIHGPFLFGATDKFADILHSIEKLPPIVILRLRNMTAIDATGLGAIRDLADTLHESGRSLLLCGAREQPSRLMKQAEFERHVGAENICGSITEAIARAAEIYRTLYANKTTGELTPTRP